MPNKTQIIIGVLILAVVFAVGRYTAPEKVRVETKIVEVEKKTEDKNTKKNEHKKVVIVKNPDGTTTTTITDDTNTDITDHKTDDIAKSETQSKETSKGDNSVTISALAGINVLHGGTPIYGGQISKPLLGPVVIGVWGLTNATGGVSLGLRF